MKKLEYTFIKWNITELWRAVYILPFLFILSKLWKENYDCKVNCFKCQTMKLPRQISRTKNYCFYISFDWIRCRLLIVNKSSMNSLQHQWWNLYKNIIKSSVLQNARVIMWIICKYQEIGKFYFWTLNRLPFLLLNNGIRKKDKAGLDQRWYAEFLFKIVLQFYLENQVQDWTWRSC